MSLQKVNQTTGELTQIAGLSGGGGGGETYYPGPGIDISSDNVISSKAVEFAGTQAQWDALSAEEKATYDYINITDDTNQIQYSPGHSISDGTSEKTQREVLEFDGFNVTDDSANGKTKVAEVPYTAGSLIDITNKEISVDGDKVKATFVGTIAEWEALSASEKAEYELVNLTDDLAGGAQAVVDAVEENNFSPVTSNAVYGVAADLDALTETVSILAGKELFYVIGQRPASGTTMTLNDNRFIAGKKYMVIYVTTAANGALCVNLPTCSTNGQVTFGSIIGPISSLPAEQCFLCIQHS